MNRRTLAAILVGDCIIPLRMSMCDAMMNRPLIARLETVLRHRRRNTRKQRSKKRDNFQAGHLHALKRDENSLPARVISRTIMPSPGWVRSRNDICG
jgi:hypothetical protein